MATYDFPVSAAGSYTINAFDTTNNTSTFETLVVNKAVPALALPNFPISGIYTGKPFMITATMATLNNQLTGNLFINNVNSGSFKTQTSASEVNKGTYIAIANTLGDANYSQALR